MKFGPARPISTLEANSLDALYASTLEPLNDGIKGDGVRTVDTREVTYSSLLLPLKNNQ